MEILMKILYVVLGILAFFLLPPLIVVSLARIAGMMAALRGSSPDVLNSLEPRVKFWSGGLILWTFGLCGSLVAYMVFE